MLHTVSGVAQLSSATPQEITWRKLGANSVRGQRGMVASVEQFATQRAVGFKTDRAFE